MNQEEQNSVSRDLDKLSGIPTADLDSILLKKGYRSGRLFRSQNKATYTFVEDDEVIALHFDLDRHDLFLKGHKLAGLTDHPHLENFLARFKKALTEENVPSEFLSAFDKAVSKLRK